MERTSESKTRIGIWDSAKQLLEFSTWLPEVVGQPREILQMGLYRERSDNQQARLRAAR